MTGRTELQPKSRTETTGRDAPRTNRLAGFDALRLFALLAIFAQHVYSVTGRDADPVVAGFRIGRFGTATFFALSGYFAAASTLAPGAWLARRFAHLMPAFWVVTAAGFAAAAVTGSRAFDAWQVVCQMAGVGPFTHPGQLVNVVTWFVTLLGLLYVVVYAARRTHEAAVVGLTAVAAGCYAVGPEWRQFDIMACQVVTFCAGYVLARTRGRPSVMPLVYVGSMAVLIPTQPELTYGVTALVLVWAAAGIRADWPAGRVSSHYAYEWFLVHGLCLHAARMAVGPQPWAVAAVAAVLAVVAAVGLRETLDWLRGRGRAHRPAPTDRPASVEREEGVRTG